MWWAQLLSVEVGGLLAVIVGSGIAVGSEEEGVAIAAVNLLGLY